jgi:phage shock protein A
MSEAYSKAVIGFTGLVEVIAALETELKETNRAVEALQARLALLENTQSHHHSVLEDLTANGLPEGRFERLDERVSELEERCVQDRDLEDRVAVMIDDRIEDAIDSALSGREVEVTLTGSVTL